MPGGPDRRRALPAVPNAPKPGSAVSRPPCVPAKPGRARVLGAEHRFPQQNVDATECGHVLVVDLDGAEPDTLARLPGRCAAPVRCRSRCTECRVRRAAAPSARSTWWSTGASALKRTLRPKTWSWSSSTETWREPQSRCEPIRSSQKLKPAKKSAGFCKPCPTPVIASRISPMSSAASRLRPKMVR